MRAYPSLQRRLLWLTLTTVATVWLVASVLTYLDARHEYNEVLDAHLAQDAALLMVQVPHELDEVETEHAPLLHKYSRRVAFQVWENGEHLGLHSANAPQTYLSSVQQGFSVSTIAGQRWRVFSTWDDDGEYLIQMAELLSVREELARDVAINLLQPLLFSLPLLAFLIWSAVARGLRPLAKLSGEIGRRAPDNLVALDAGVAPREVVPLIERLNRLFVRIAASIQQERRFTADAAHELRTPVAAIKAQLQVAQGADAEAERNRALNNAMLGCDRAAHLIDQLLTLARVDSLDDNLAAACPLANLAAEVIATIAPGALHKGVQLELLEGGGHAVRGNAALLRVLLRNLIDNAVKHSPKGTRVRVAIGKSAAGVVLTVTDNGPGIPEAEREKVLQRFYRPLGTEASGSGLGLSIIKRIAEVHGASLRLQPAEGGGLQVLVTFRELPDNS
ncbi:MAG: ATP-binding protein [Pseudomonadota bacterium]